MLNNNKLRFDYRRFHLQPDKTQTMVGFRDNRLKLRCLEKSSKVTRGGQN